MPEFVFGDIIGYPLSDDPEREFLFMALAPKVDYDSAGNAYPRALVLRTAPGDVTWTPGETTLYGVGEMVLVEPANGGSADFHVGSRLTIPPGLGGTYMVSATVHGKPAGSQWLSTLTHKGKIISTVASSNPEQHIHTAMIHAEPGETVDLSDIGLGFVQRMGE